MNSQMVLRLRNEARHRPKKQLTKRRPEKTSTNPIIFKNLSLSIPTEGSIAHPNKIQPPKQTMLQDSSQPQVGYSDQNLASHTQKLKITHQIKSLSD